MKDNGKSVYKHPKARRISCGEQNKHCGNGADTLPANSPSVVLIKEEKKRRCLYPVKPLRSPQFDLLDKSIFFLSTNWFFECEHPFIDKPMVRTEPAVASARSLGLDSKPIFWQRAGHAQKGSHSIHESFLSAPNSSKGKKGSVGRFCSWRWKEKKKDWKCR